MTGGGLFRRAITRSGAGHHAHTPETARRITERLAALVGAGCTVEALAAVPPQDLVAANSRLAEEIARSTDPGQWGEPAGGGTTVLPVAGTATLPERPVDAVRRRPRRRGPGGTFATRPRGRLLVCAG
ncbi:hypothetical protein [Streptomyces sp. NPDC002164]|uniref:hypothetical protein n=1 Tax=unclassified Streptomyces TaxID=2593676 RepID=UPI0036C35303